MPAVVPALVAPLLAVVRETESSSCGSTCVRNWKIGFTAILIAEGLLFAHLIFLLRRFFAKSPGLIDKATLYGHAVSAGIFLATGFMHILPEAIELIAGEHSGHGGHGGTGGTGSGQNVQGEDGHEGHDHGDEDGHDHGEEEAAGNESTTGETLPFSENRLARALTKLAIRQDDDHDHASHGDEHGEEGHKLEFPWAMFIMLMAFYLLFFLEKIFVPVILKRARAKAAATLGAEEADKQGLTEGVDPHETDPVHCGDHNHGLAAPEDVEHDVHADGKLPGIVSLPFAIALIQVVGLSAHSLFESMALGLGSSITTVVNVFIATVSHRWATALAISVIISRRVSYLAFIVLIALFTAVVPIGVGIGAGVSHISQQVQGVLFAISAGTFLYIGVIEGLGAAFSGHHKESRLLLFLAAFLGSAFIIVVTGILVGAGVEH